MLKRIVFICISVSFLLLGNQAFAQDPEFSQFYANPLYLNPAFAGTARCPRIVFNYRNQWPAISGTFVTYSASYDQHIDALSGGIGILATEDKAGIATINTANISGIYSYQLNVTRLFSVNIGLQATYHEKSVDWSKLTWGDMIDPKRGFIYNTNATAKTTKVSMPDFSAGILGFGKEYYFGFSVDHLTQPDESFISGPSPLPMKYTAHVGAMIPINSRQVGEDVSISPNILYQKQQDFQQLNLGLYLKKGPIVGGLWYRNQDAFIALIGFQQNLFKFGYSYDVTISKLSNATAGSHELSMSIVFQCRPKRRRFRTINCPSF